MTIHTDVQKLKESKDFNPQGLIQTGPKFMPDHSPKYPFLDKKSSSSSSSSKDSKTDETADFQNGALAPVPAALPPEPIVVLKSIMTWLNSGFPMHVKKGTQHPKQACAMDLDDHSELKEAALFSLDEIVDRLMQKMLVVMACSERIDKFVLVADRRQYVPSEKGKTQAKRNQKADPYPQGTQIGTNGLKLPGSREECMIQVQRLMQTRELREDFFRAIHRRLLSKRDQFPDHCDVILDLLHQPPLELVRNGTNKVLFDQEWKIGEDDLCLPRWCIHFGQTHQCLVQTCDRDLDDILMLVHEHIPKYLILDFEDGRFEAIHENALALEQAGWTVQMYVTACILCGTDFHPKNSLTDQIGVKTIFQAVAALCMSKRLTKISNLKDLELLLTMVYSSKLNSKKILSGSAIHAALVQKNSKKVHWPIPNQVKAGFATLSWNLSYWSSLGGALLGTALPRCPQTPQSSGSASFMTAR